MDVIVDQTILAQLREILADEVDGLLQNLFQTAPQQITEFSSAQANGDLVTAARIVHTLKSSSGNLGLVAFASLCREAENSARQGQMTADEPWQQRLLDALNQAQTTLGKL